jgi:hypothetical protein
MGRLGVIIDGLIDVLGGGKGQVARLGGPPFAGGRR